MDLGEMACVYYRHSFKIETLFKQLNRLCRSNTINKLQVGLNVETLKPTFFDRTYPLSIFCVFYKKIDCKGIIH
jgi:hypothetical protein